MFTPFFSLAAVSPGRQLAFRYLVIAHLMILAGCVQCGRTTTSVEGVCSSCQDLRVAPSPRSRDRALTQRRVTRSQPRNA